MRDDLDSKEGFASDFRTHIYSSRQGHQAEQSAMSLPLTVQSKVFLPVEIDSPQPEESQKKTSKCEQKEKHDPMEIVELEQQTAEETMPTQQKLHWMMIRVKMSQK